MNAGRLDDLSEGWPLKPPGAHLHNSYLDHSREVGVRRRSVEMDVMRRLRKVFGKAMRTGRLEQIGGKRTRVVRLPPLEKARKLFEAYLGCEPDWDPVDTEGGDE